MGERLELQSVEYSCDGTGLPASWHSRIFNEFTAIVNGEVKEGLISETTGGRRNL